MEKVPVNFKALAIKCRSKKEQIHFSQKRLRRVNVSYPRCKCCICKRIDNWSYQCLLYLLTLNFLDKFVRNKDTKIIQVPLKKSFKIEEILIFWAKNVDIHEYLTKYRKVILPNRQWLWNLSIKFINIFIAHTLNGSKFKEWINEIMDKSKKRIVLKKSFTVQVFPEFSKAFEFSKSVPGICWTITILTCYYWSNQIFNS